MDNHLGGLHADAGLQRRGYFRRHGVVRRGIVGVLLNFHGVLAGEVLLENADQVFTGDAVQVADHGLDIAREHVHGGNDEHVVLPAVDMDPSVGSAAGAGGVVDPADVAGAEADQGTGVLAQRGKDQLADLAGLQHFAGMDIHRLHQDVVLRNVQAVLGFAHGRAGAEDIGKAVEVIHFSAPQLFNGMPGGLNGAAQFAGHDNLPDVQILLGINAALERLFTQLPGVGGAGPDHGGLIGLQHVEEAFAGQRAAPDAQGAEVLGADDVRAAHIQGKVQCVDVPVGGPHAHLPEPAALRFLELVKVLLGEGAHGRNTGGTGGGGNEDHVFFRHGAQFTEEGADALGVALRPLVDERELPNVL